MEADATRTTAAPATPAPVLYDGFISYSHAADGLLAPRLQSGLQRFAKPWWKRRALRVFRDESSLSANPHLWSSITEALDSSAWFVLLLSPDAAASQWVNQEIEYWRSGRDPSRILPVVTGGEFGWDGDVAGDAVPDELRGVFSEEPRWVDLRFARDEEQLDLKDPRFADAVADIASALRGVPKDELASEEVRQHRRTIRTAWAGIGVIGILGLAAIAFGISASRNADEAGRQAQLARSRELATAAVAVVEQDPELATLLAVEAIRGAPTGSGVTPELVSGLRLAGSSNRLTAVVEVPAEDSGFTTMAISRDGTRLVVVAEDAGWIAAYSTDDLASGPIWERSVDARALAFPEFAPDGALVGVAFGPVSESGPPFPQGILVLDASDGSEVTRLEYPDCTAIDQHAWSPDGKYLVVGTPPEPCDRADASSPIWAEVFATDSWMSVGVIDGPEGASDLKPDFDDKGRLLLSGFSTSLTVWDPSGPTLLGTVGDDVFGIAADHPSGPYIATFSNQRDAFALRVHEFDSGQLVDRIPLPAFPNAPQGMAFSLDGELLVVGTTGSTTLVLDPATGVTVLSVPAESAPTVALDAERGRLYTSHDGEVRVWDVGGATFGVEVLSTFSPERNVNANTAAVGPTSASVGGVIATPDGFVEFALLVDRATGEIVDEIEGSQIEWLADGRFVYRRRDGVVALFDPSTGAERQAGGCVTSDFITCESGEPWLPVTPITWDDENVMVLVDGAGHARYISTETLDTQREIDLGTEGDRYVQAVGGTAEWLAVILDRSVAVVDAETGDDVWRKEIFAGRGDVSPDGGHVVLQSSKGVFLVDTETWEERTIDADFGDTRGIEFSPSGDRLALGDDQQIWIVDVESARVEQTIPRPRASDFIWLSEREFAHDSGGVWGVIDLDDGGLVDEALASLQRGFTSGECERYGIDPCPSLEELRGG